MIAKIRGIFTEYKPPVVLIDVSGLYYEVNIPLKDTSKLPLSNQEISLYTHFIVKEDAHTLFGFFNIEDKNIFKDLIKVSGIGPRIALACLSKLDSSDIISAIKNKNINLLSSIPGIGKKIAERIVLELQDKLSNSIIENTINNHLLTDIYSALLSLGYKNKEVELACKDLEFVSLQDGLPKALQRLSTGKF